MTKVTLAVLAATLGATAAHGGALDRSNQDIDIIFEEGNYLNLNAGYVAAFIDGEDRFSVGPGGVGPGGQGTGDVGDNYFQGSIGYKHQLTDQLSLALIIDQPYGADIDYPSFTEGGSQLLGGTQAFLDSIAYTGLARWQFNDRFSLHGGFRVQQLNAAVSLSGIGFGGLDGYTGIFDGDTAVGWQVGGAFEIPSIALRISATYFSEIEHELEASETLGGGALAFVNDGDFTIDTPQALNIGFQTGIAPDTLLFGSFRFADYSSLEVVPPEFENLVVLGGGAPGTSLVAIDPVRDYTLGVGRQFTDKFAASVAVNFSDLGPDNDVSPLAPINGRIGVTVGGSYQVTEALEVSGGINYTSFFNADASPGSSGTVLTDFDDNDAVAVGFSLGYRF